MDRRKFITLSCRACLAASSMGLLLQGCASFPMIEPVAKNDEIKIPVTKFAELDTDKLLIRNKTLDNDILLVKNGETYTALLMKCTHQGYPLTPSGNKIHCSAHGSTFNLEGEVLQSPALTPLTQFKVKKENQNLIINLNS